MTDTPADRPILAAQTAKLREIVGRMTPGLKRDPYGSPGRYMQSGDGEVVVRTQYPNDQAGFLALRNNAMPIIDAQAARIAELERALRSMVFIYNYGDAAAPGYRVSVMEEARAALEGRAS